jgi:leader peptidase (prepilin peptidase)/N-methyltransferase
MLGFLQTHVWFSAIIIGVLSLIVGSFLNVVIYRYPAMMKQEWLRFCLLFLKEQKIKIQHHVTQKINFIYPRSHCPICKRLLQWIYKIPVLSYMILKGKCAYCKVRISPFYPIIELLTAGLGVIVFLFWGWHIQTLCILYFTWILIVISAIDTKTRLIPDTCVFLLLWGGLLINGFATFVLPIEAILGVVIGYVGLKIFQKAFYWVRKKEGIGEGDLKLTAALSAWLGIKSLPLLLLLAAVVALIVSILLIVFRQIKWNTMIAFGPFLSLSGWLLLVFPKLFQQIWLTMLS